MPLVAQVSTQNAGPQVHAGSAWIAPGVFAVLGAGLIVFATLMRRRHWVRVRGGTVASETSAVWTDVFLQMLRLLGGILLLTGLIMFVAMFRRGESL